MTETGILAAVHKTGCQRIAFYSTKFAPDRPVTLPGGVAPAPSAATTCANCGSAVSAADLELRGLMDPRPRVTPRRVPMRQHDAITVAMLRDLASGPNLTTTQLANAIGISQTKMRDLLNAGDVPQAFRISSRGDFRVPWDAARGFARRIGAIGGVA